MKNLIKYRKKSAKKGLKSNEKAKVGSSQKKNTYGSEQKEKSAEKIPRSHIVPGSGQKTITPVKKNPAGKKLDEKKIRDDIDDNVLKLADAKH